MQIKEHAQSLPQQSERLRQLSPQQKKALVLFVKQREISLIDFSEHLKLKPRTTYALPKKWLKEFIQIENTSKKVPTYLLTVEWEQIVVNSHKEFFT
tara:strand:- start:179 stop:469 length:291 start_codon:yes stop_codon:yes gene_type:complete